MSFNQYLFVGYKYNHIQFFTAIITHIQMKIHKIYSELLIRKIWSWFIRRQFACNPFTNSLSGENIVLKKVVHHMHLYACFILFSLFHCPLLFPSTRNPLPYSSLIILPCRPGVPLLKTNYYFYCLCHFFSEFCYRPKSCATFLIIFHKNISHSPH